MNIRVITEKLMLVLLVALATLHTPPPAQASGTTPGLEPYVRGLFCISKKQVSHNVVDASCLITVVNPGPALANAVAYASTRKGNLQIMDNEVVLGNVPAGSSLISSDTFTVRVQGVPVGKITMPFLAKHIDWSFEAGQANTPPVARAGSDQTARTGETVTLDASGSGDADGDALSYRWSVLARPPGSTSTLSSASAVRPTFRLDRAGNYAFRLVVNDGAEDSLPDDVGVSTINSAPLANAGADRTVARGSTVVLDGSASSDPDFDGLAFQWSILLAPAGSSAVLVNSTTMMPSITLDLPGSYTLRLVVNDGALASAPDEIVLSTQNSIPLANAGTDQGAVIGNLVTLDGRASGDADGDALSFSWTWQSRPAGSAAALQSAMMPQPTFTPDVLGDYVAQLIVNDGFSDSAPDSTVVSVTAPPNRAPLALNDSATTPAATPVDINVLANDSDPDGDPLTISTVSQPANGSTAIVGNMVRLTPAAGFSGPLAFTYGISDGRGGSASATVNVTVTSTNTPPTAGDDSAITAQDTPVDIAVLDNDSDADGDSLSISGVGTPAHGSAAIHGSGVRYTPAAGFVGGDSFGYTISDGQGGSASALVSVTVAATGNQPPQVNAGPDQALLLPFPNGQIETLLVGTITDDGLPSSGTLTSSWSLVSGPGPAAFVAANAASSGLQLALPGIYTLRLTANDGEQSASDELTVSLGGAANSAPQLLPVGNRSLEVGEELSLQMVASDSDPADVLTFSLLDGPAGALLDATARLTFTPDGSQVGSHGFTIRVQDAGGLSDSGSFVVSVTTANRPPVLAPLSDETAPALGRYARTLLASDADGDALTFELLSGPAGMSLGGDTVNWQPSASQLGLATARVLVRDTAGAYAVGLWRIDVTSNAAPVARDDEYTVEVGQLLTVAPDGVLANDADPDGGPLSAARMSDPALGSVTSFGADGGFTYQAPAAFTAPALNPEVAYRSGTLMNPNMSSLVVDMNRDGVPELLFGDYGGLAAFDGRTRQLVWRYNHGDTNQAVGAGCGGYGTSVNQAGVAAGALQAGGDIMIVMSARCAGPDGQSGSDQFMALNGTPLAGGTVAVQWVTERLTRPHPDAMVNPNDAAPPPAGDVRPFYGATATTLPTLARLQPGGAVKLLSRRKIPTGTAIYYARNESGSPVIRHAACRAVTGLAADEGRACNVTWIVDAATGVVEQVLTSPNPSNAGTIPSWRPWQQNPPFVADLNGDGQVEIISGSDVFHLVNGSWSLAWQTQYEPSSVLVADVTGDGQPELVQYQAEFGTTAANSGIVIYRGDGTLLRRIPFALETITAPITAADLDGDGAAEILQPDNGYLYARRGDGRTMWVYAIPDSREPALSGQVLGPNPQWYRGSTHPAHVYDLDLDGNPEVILTGSRSLFILDGRTGQMKWTIDTESYTLDEHGTVVADLDADGHVDILTNDQNRWACGTVQCRGSVLIISGADNNWAPGSPIWNQINFRPGSVSDTGEILYDPSVRRDFRVQQQRGIVTDPRLRQGTSFSYVARDGGSESVPATVYLQIAPPNRPPVITSLPPTGLLSVAPYTRPIYQITATDPDAGDTVRYELVSENHPLSANGGITLDTTTGALSFYTGPCGSYGGPCGQYFMNIVVAAVDSLGARAEQSFVVYLGYFAKTAPNLLGLTSAAAGDSAAAAGLQARVVEERHDNAPAGQVLSQFPLAGTTGLGQYASIDIVVSKGRTPVITPNLVGLVEAQASTRRATAGFDAGTVTRVFSDSVPRGEVIAQNPAAGSEVVPAEMALTVSAGNGLVLRLATAVATAGQSIPLQAYLVGTDGSETPTGDVSFSISARPTPTGSLPTAAGSSISTSASTRGAFTVTATYTDGRSASGDFAVGPPLLGDGTDMASLFGEMTSAMAEIDELLVATRAALQAGDVNAQRSLLVQMVQRWRLVDIESLKLATAMAPELGFLPLASELAGLGLSSTPEDVLIEQVLRDADADLQAWIAGHRAPTTSLVELNALADAFATRASRLNGLFPSEWGAINAAPLYTLLAARRLPELYESIMNELAVVVGEPPTRTASLAPQQASTRLAAQPGKQMYSTLVELAVTQASQWVVDKMVDNFNQKYKNAKQFGTDIMKQAFWGAATVAAVSHIRSWVQGRDIDLVTSGASLSFHVFGAQYSMIESEIDLRYPAMNRVYIIGPALLEDPRVRSFLESLKTGVNYRLSPTDNDGKYKSPADIFKQLNEFRQHLEGLLQAGQGLEDAVLDSTQVPTDIDRPCISSLSPTCGQLLFENGFKSVYSYTPPPGFEGFSGLPVPIVMIVFDQSSQNAYFATPPFLPTPRAP